MMSLDGGGMENYYVIPTEAELAEEQEAMERSAQVFHGMEKRDADIEAAFLAHVARVKATLGLQDYYGETAQRVHHDAEDGRRVASWSYVYYAGGQTPLLVGTVLREENHMLLSIIDRTGSTPTVHEASFC
jgi:hypothetical protein